MKSPIAVRDLRKVYRSQGDRRRQLREVVALDGITFAIARGEFFGVLGPNGAGKTTTIGILTVRPTSVRALIEGMDVARDPVAVKRRIGVVPQANNLDRSLTGRENLLFHAAHFGIPRLERERRAQELVERFQLAERADGFSLFFTFSGLRQFDRRAID